MNAKTQKTQIRTHNYKAIDRKEVLDVVEMIQKECGTKEGWKCKMEFFFDEHGDYILLSFEGLLNPLVERDKMPDGSAVIWL